MSRTSSPRAQCLFCLSALGSNRSNEHVIPVWLMEHLGVRNRGISPTRFNPEGQPKSTRRHTLDELTEGRVCRGCNSGWMSAMEATCKPLLVPLVEGIRDLGSVRLSDRAKLARWAAKTAWVLNSASNYDDLVPPQHFRHLIEGNRRLPKGVVVVAQQHALADDFFWYQGAIWPVVGDCSLREAEFERLRNESYKISLQFGRLMLLVAWWPHQPWSLVLEPGVHRPLWPNQGAVLYASSRSGPPPQTKVEALVAFHCGLAIANTQRNPLGPEHSRVKS